MIRRVTDRSTFARFRQGSRARCGPLQVRYVEADPAAPDLVRVAYAIGRPMGNAVERNRARRRLRSAVRELDTSGQVPPGAYLVSLSSPVRAVPYPELMSHLGTAISRAATTSGR